MKSEVICYVATDEEGEFVMVSRVMSNHNLFLFSLGERKLVVNIHDLCEAIETIGQFSQVLDVKSQQSEDRRLGVKRPPVSQVQASSKEAPELEFHFNNEVTDSEKDLEEILKENLNE